MRFELSIEHSRHCEVFDTLRPTQFRIECDDGIAREYVDYLNRCEYYGSPALDFESWFEVWGVRE